MMASKKEIRKLAKRICERVGLPAARKYNKEIRSPYDHVFDGNLRGESYRATFEAIARWHLRKIKEVEDA